MARTRVGPVRPVPEGAGAERAVWVMGDLRARAQEKATLELLRRASPLAGRRGAPLCLVLLGKGLPPRLEGFRHGLQDRVYVVDHPRLSGYRQETYTWVLEDMVRKFRPETFLFLANDCGRELAPRLAAKLGTGLCADCIGLEVEADTGLLVHTVPAFGDQVVARIVTPVQRPQMATVRPGPAPKPEGHSARSGEPEIVHFPFPDCVPRERIACLGVEREATAGEALENARAVVCGGRGLETGKNFQSLWNLAALLGAEVAGTRPAVQAHWIESDCMVGQTGRTVAPELLLLFGISGATQFTASIQQARYIVAINKDPRAAVFCHADLGIVGDVKQVLPLLTQRVQEALVSRYGRSPEEIFGQGGRPQGVGLGTRLRNLRQKRGYQVEEVARALDLDPGLVERVERNEEAPSVSYLLRISQLFRVDPAPFLSQAEGVRADRKRQESFVKRTQSYSYRTLTPGAEQKHLRAFQVAIDPGRDHKMVEYRHEGEEFVYVLGGQVEIKVGEEVHRLQPGESLHFEGSIPHHLRNPSRTKADLIVVLYTP